MRVDRIAISAAFLGALFCSCRGESGSPAAEILVEDAWARPMPLLSAEGGSTNSAVYLRLRNPDRLGYWLLGGTTPVATSVEVHESVLMGEVMSMRRLDRLEIPAGSEVQLEPGGLHLMLLGLNQPLAAGDGFEMTLLFEGSHEVEVLVSVGTVVGG